MVAHWGLSPTSLEALTRVIYSLCVRYPSASKAAMSSLLVGPTSPVKRGAMGEGEVGRLVAAACREEPHNYGRFQGREFDSHFGVDFGVDFGPNGKGTVFVSMTRGRMLERHSMSVVECICHY